MDRNEIITLGIVGLAALVSLRYFLGKKGGGCCGSGCVPKFEKKDKNIKSEDKT